MQLGVNLLLHVYVQLDPNWPRLSALAPQLPTPPLPAAFDPGVTGEAGTQKKHRE